jgi:hypothetical protein
MKFPLALSSTAIFAVVLSTQCFAGSSAFHAPMTPVVARNVAADRRLTCLAMSNKVERIVHELEELTQQRHILESHSDQHVTKGFDEPHDTLLHKWRKAAHDRDLTVKKLEHELAQRTKRHADLDKLLHSTMEAVQHQLARDSQSQTIRPSSGSGSVASMDEKKHQETLPQLLDTLIAIERELNESRALPLTSNMTQIEPLPHERQESDNNAEISKQSLRRLWGQAAAQTFRRFRNRLGRIVFFWRK